MDDPFALLFLTAAATLRVATPLILCAMGGLTPNPVRSALLHFPEDFTARDKEETR